MSTRIWDYLTAVARDVAGLRSEMARINVREGKGPKTDRLNIIRATVQASAVTTDANVSVTSAIARKGRIPTDDPFLFVNQFAKDYTIGDKVWLLKGDDGKWYPDQTDTGSGSRIAYFELKDNLFKSDDYALAYPVHDDDTIDTGDDNVRLLNHDHRFMGKKPPDADGSNGYRYFAEFLTDDDDSSGVPGWRIIAGEGPAEFFVGTVVSPPSGDSTVTIDSNDVPGAPDRGRLPKEDEDGHITVVDDLSIADDTDTGDKWVFKYDETADHYIFWFKISHTDDFRIIKFAAPTSLSPSDTTFTVSSYSVVQGTLPTGTLTIHNDLPIRCNSGDTLYARWNKTIPGWDVNDEGNEEHHLRGKDDYDYTKVMVLESNSGAFHWVESRACS